MDNKILDRKNALIHLAVSIIKDPALTEFSQDERDDIANLLDDVNEEDSSHLLN